MHVFFYSRKNFVPKQRKYTAQAHTRIISSFAMACLRMLIMLYSVSASALDLHIKYDTVRIVWQTEKKSIEMHFFVIDKL